MCLLKSKGIKGRAEKSFTSLKVRREQKVKILVIVNPVAGKTSKRWPDINRILREREYDYEVQFTEERGHATQLAAKAHKFDIIASVGGDGTLNEIVNGLMGKDGLKREVTLSVIPTGTANDFVKSANLFTDFRAAAQNIIPNNTKKVDVGSIRYAEGNRFFIGVAGMGFDGLVSKTTCKIDKPKVGTVPYLLGVLKHLAQYESVRVSVTIDDTVLEQEVMFVDVANGKYVGAGMTIAPYAEVDDGLFDVIVIGNFGRVESLIRLPTLYKGTHLNNPRVGFFRGKHVELKSETPLSIHVEGEYIGVTPAAFDILERALTVSAPSQDQPGNQKNT